VATHIEIRFVSNNEDKITEAKKILGDEISVVESRRKIEELQTTDPSRLVRDKLLKAYRQIGRPLFVEHTGLHLDHLNGLPGGLTQIFWDALQADRFAELFGKLASNHNATARTSIAYCDGRKVFEFEGAIVGEITVIPRGPRHFQWDCVFQPTGRSETFAEMGDKKNDISMRRIALEKLVAHLRRDLSV
jgi:XTP/dITP diphosphohydrolase